MFCRVSNLQKTTILHHVIQDANQFGHRVFSYQPINEIDVRLESLIVLEIRYRRLVLLNQTISSKP